MSYAGRPIEEIVMLATDIIENAPKDDMVGYVLHCMIPAAQQAYFEYGDEFVYGYHVSTAIHCAEQVARELTENGMINLS